MNNSFPKNELAVLGQTTFRGQHVKFGIKLDDRRRHVYLLGKTGMGKSTLMQAMMIQDIANGKGLGIIDPHGDSAELMLQYIPQERINDVIYFNPSDLDFPFAFNIFESVSESERHLVASGLLGVFKKLWAETWGPRLEYLLNNAIMALLEYPDSTILGVMRILVDKDFRKQVVDYISDPVIKSFWINEYAKYPDRFQQEAIAPIQNKVGRFLSSPMMRNIIGQVHSSINIREVLDGNKILIMNLSKGRIGEDNSALLGAMMITKIQLAAMSRVNVHEAQRKDFFLYVDEFQNFSTESFANILSEARKYRLDLTLAHQYIMQLDEKVAAAIFGNIGTMCIFRVGAEDAEVLLKEFEPQFDENDLVNIPKYHCLTKLMIDGISSEPFLANSLPLPQINDNQAKIVEKIIDNSRQQYATPRGVVEEKISTWTGLAANNLSINNKNDQGSRHFSVNKTINESRPNQTIATTPPKGNKAYCDDCSKEIYVPFVPDPARKVYCPECLAKNRRQKSPKIEQLKANFPPLPPMVSIKEALKNNPISFGNNRSSDIKDKPKIDNSNNEEQSSGQGHELLPDKIVRFDS
jgi:CxxC-x17-CxxC domain-containing protein